MKTKFTSEYRVFRRKITLRIACLALLSIGAVFLFYWFIWYEKAGEWVLALLRFLGMNQHEAFEFLHLVLRQNRFFIMGFAVICVFCIFLRFLFVSFIRYLDNVNQGIDKLLTEDNEPLHLLPEMAPMEKKLNTVKQTLWQRKQESLQAEKRKDELVMYLAHDIRTPLTSVIGYLNVLEETPGLPADEREKYIHIATEKAYRLEKMVNEFFEITRYRSRQVTLSKVQINLSLMLAQMMDEHTPLLSAHGNRMVLDADERLCVCADPDKLARVFGNLLKNAAAYSYPDTEIRITAQSDGGFAEIRFLNHGKTIPPQQLQMLFQKFFRLDEARKSDTGGSGLGLAIAHEIVEMHGGSMEASSANDTVTFTVRLPKK